MAWAGSKYDAMPRPEKAKSRGRQKALLQVPGRRQLAIDRLPCGALLDGAPQVTGHAVVAADQLRQLVFALQLGAVVELALLQLAEGHCQARRSPGDAPDQKGCENPAPNHSTAVEMARAVSRPMEIRLSSRLTFTPSSPASSTASRATEDRSR